jgi:hypothetical protein
LLLSEDISLVKPVAAAPGASFQQFSEFLHRASPTVRKKVSTGLIPAVEMAKTDPITVAAVHADVDRSLFGTLVVAAVVFLHGS